MELLHIMVAVKIKSDSGSNRKTVRFRPFKIQFQKMVPVDLFRIVSENEGFHVYIIYHKVKVSVIVEIPIGTTVRHTGNIHAPICCCVVKGDILLVVEGIVGQVNPWHLIDDGVYGLFFSGKRHFLNNVVGKEVHKIEVGQVVVDPVGYIDIAKTVVVHIEDKP